MMRSRSEGDAVNGSDLGSSIITAVRSMSTIGWDGSAFWTSDYTASKNTYRIGHCFYFGIGVRPHSHPHSKEGLGKMLKTAKKRNDRYKKLMLGAVIMGLLGLPATGSATIIYDPLHVGASQVFPGNLTAVSTTTSQIIVGYAGAGTLEVNGSPTGNGKTAIFGNYPGGIGAVVGFYSPGRLMVKGGLFETQGDIQVGWGTGGDGTLEVIEGGAVRTTREGQYAGSGLTLGNGGGKGTVLVDGAGSSLNVTDRIRVGGFDNTVGNLTVSNGGFVSTNNSNGTSVNFDGAVEIGTGEGASGSVTVTGNGSHLETGGLIIGNGTSSGAQLRIENGGLVTAAALPPVGSFTWKYSGGVGVGGEGGLTNATVDITGAGSKLQISPHQIGQIGSELTIGGFAPGSVIVDDNGLLDVGGGNINVGTYTYYGTPPTSPGQLNVRNDGKVIADTINVGQTGTLTGGGGTIEANVVVDGGVLSPGNSPGTMTIDGNANFLSGVLELEITQTAMDRLIVTGDLNFGKDLMLSLLFDFDPINYILNLDSLFDVTGDFRVDQDFNLANNLTTSGLLNNSSLTVNFLSDQRIFGNPAGPSTSVPEPATILLVSLGLLGLGAFKRGSA